MKPLAEIIDFYNGKVPPEQREGGAFPIYGSNGVIGFTEQANHENAIILGRVGAYCGSVEYCPSRFWASDNTIVVKPLGEHDVLYLYYRLKSAPLRGYAGGAAQPLLTHGILRGIKLEIADESAQPRIASVLSSYDDLMANNRRRIELLEQSAQLLFNEWFVRLLYPGHEHDEKVNGVPKGWEWKTLGDIATTNRESYTAKSLPFEINYIDISSVQAGRVLYKSTMVAADAPGRARRRIQDGDVIWSNVRPNLRQFALVLEPADNDVVSTGFTTLSASAVPSAFLYCAVTTDAFVQHLINHTTGASYPAVRPEDFERARLLVPSKSLQDEFSTHCEPIFRLAHKLDIQNKRLAEARDLLLPRLMDGRLSV